jgi:hypothetical protein
VVTWEEFVATCIPLPYTVRFEQLGGGGGYGEIFDPAVPFGPCVIEDTSRTVAVQTADAQGAERVSSTTVYGPLEPPVTPGSRVTLPWRAVPATVLAVSRLDDHGLELPAHQELSLE